MNNPERVPVIRAHAERTDYRHNVFYALRWEGFGHWRDVQVRQAGPVETWTGPDGVEHWRFKVYHWSAAYVWITDDTAGHWFHSQAEAYRVVPTEPDDDAAGAGRVWWPVHAPNRLVEIAPSRLGGLRS